MPVTVIHALQKRLKNARLYTGEIDGDVGPLTRRAINKYLDQNRINTDGWSNSRKEIAAEQLYYKAHQIDAGKIDGIIGPQTRYAREIYEAKLVGSFRDEVDPGEIKKVEVPDAPKISSKAWPTQKGVPSFYGSVGSNQVTLKMPFPMVLAWDKSKKVYRYSCHRKVHDSMLRVWNRTFDFYGHQKIQELGLDLFGGCLNVRKMRGGSRYSMHSWGIAIDIDPSRNSLRTSWKNSQMSKPEYKQFVQFWYDEGFINLGLEADFDAMHYQAARIR